MKKLSLLKRLLIPVFVTLIFGMGALSFLTYQTSSVALDEAMNQRLDELTHGLGKQIELWMDNLVFAVEQEAGNDIHSILLESDRPSPLAAKKSNTNLANVVKKSDYVLRLGLLNQQGIAVAHSTSEKVGTLNLSERGYFQQAMQGKTVISPVLISKVSQKPVFVVAVPVKVGDTVLGALYAAIDLDLFSQRFISPVKIGEHGYAYIVDSRGKVTAHPNPKAILKVDLNTFEWGKEMLQQKTGTMHYTYKGDDKIAAFYTEPTSGWLVAAGTTISDFNGAAILIMEETILFGVIFVLVIGAVLFFTAKPAVRAIRQSVDLAASIRQGDLSQRLELNRSDEVGQLCQALNEMAEGLESRAQLATTIAEGKLTQEVELASDKDTLGLALQSMVTNLNQILSQIRTAGEQIDSGSSQVADSAQTLSSGATEQASSLEEISSTIAEIASQTQTNADNAQVAATLGADAQRAADQGTTQMETMVRAMQEIKDAGEDISRIIKTIDEIAFQTNLLALNAAVEAARAGQHGKGFAVVAEEVRNLAARSARAASETAELIEQSVSRGESGVNVAQTTAAALTEVVTGITKTNDLIGEISAASKEQAEGISQVNEGLSQVSQVTQQNTATAEESAAASEELSGQAAHLGQLLGQFHLKESPAVMARLPQAAHQAPHQAHHAPATTTGWGQGEQPSIALNDDEFGKY